MQDTNTISPPESKPGTSIEQARRRLAAVDAELDQLWQLKPHLRRPAGGWGGQGADRETREMEAFFRILSRRGLEERYQELCRESRRLEGLLAKLGDPDAIERERRRDQRGREMIARLKAAPAIVNRRDRRMNAAPAIAPARTGARARGAGRPRAAASRSSSKSGDSGSDDGGSGDDSSPADPAPIAADRPPLTQDRPPRKVRRVKIHDSAPRPRKRRRHAGKSAPAPSQSEAPALSAREQERRRVLNRIDRAARERAHAWQIGGRGEQTAELARELEQLFAAKRRTATGRRELERVI